MTVGLVIVSHSGKIAEGVVELAGQMAPDVVIAAAGGMDDGSGGVGIGTSFERVQAGIERAAAHDGAVILTDLGSAVMTAETVLEFMEPAARDRVRLARAALVEGAVAAAVQAQGGSSLDDVLRAAEAAVVSIRPEDLEPLVTHAAAAPGSEPPAEVRTADSAAESAAGSAGDRATAARGSWVLRNRMGLHARPAAALALGLAELDAEILVNGVDATSVMLLMSLGLGQGRTLTAEATGPDARTAVDIIGQAVESGFGEPE